LHPWNLSIEETRETPSSQLIFGRWADRAVVLKTFKPHSDETNSADVIRSFDGKGMVRVIDRCEGALLLERLVPGTSLVDLALAGDDKSATGILAQVIETMDSPPPPSRCPSVEDWGRAFDRYLQGSNESIAKALVEEAQRTYLSLCESQTRRRLLHGDLHHANVLFDATRGWLAIDPKGVVGEVEYEIGAALRNPIDHPELYASTKIVKRRLDRFEETLKLDRHRALRWAFAQAVLSAIWSTEDGEDSRHVLKLAEVLRRF